MNTINKKNEGTRALVSVLGCGVMIVSVNMLTTVRLHAQTTLSGDHVITGDLNVGTSGTAGNVLVIGDTGGSAAPGLKVTGDGGVVFTGSLGIGQIPMQGNGVRFMWYPKKAALRAGYTSFGFWDDSNVGDYSVALGGGTVASGQCSTAIGYFTSALGVGSTAMGVGTWAQGSSDTAMGVSTSAMGYGSTAMGISTVAMGESSTAMGFLTGAIGDASTSTGARTYASGYASTAMGHWTSADSYASVVIGRSNVGGGNSSEWQEEDPLFEIGNGQPPTFDDAENLLTPEVPSNALTVYKNGQTTLQNKFWDEENPQAIPTEPEASSGNALVVKGRAEFKGPVCIERQGDILMGEFGNPE